MSEEGEGRYVVVVRTSVEHIMQVYAPDEETAGLRAAGRAQEKLAGTHIITGYSIVECHRMDREYVPGKVGR